MSCLRGLLDRLAYVASLRDANGQYRHWGMSRTYGPEAAGKAIAASHSRVWIDVLRTPLPKLLAELEADTPADRAELLAQLRKHSAASVPGNLAGGDAKHFRTVIMALESVSHARGGHRVA